MLKGIDPPEMTFGKKKVRGNKHFMSPSVSKEIITKGHDHMNHNTSEDTKSDMTDHGFKSN